MAAEALTVTPRVAERVHDEEIERLLGYPRGVRPSGEVLALVREARRWYARAGRPVLRFGRALALRPGADGRLVAADGRVLASRAVAGRFGRAKVVAAVPVAASAGAGLDEETEKRWPRRPDAAFVLDRLGAAVAEHLVAWSGEELARRFRPRGLAPLEPWAPGYADWSVAELETLLGWLGLDDGSIGLLPSGALRPKHSLLVLFGLAPADGAVAPAPPCSTCSLVGCALRRPVERVAAR